MLVWIQGPLGKNAQQSCIWATPMSAGLSGLINDIIQEDYSLLHIGYIVIVP